MMATITRTSRWWRGVRAAGSRMGMGDGGGRRGWAMGPGRGHCYCHCRGYDWGTQQRRRLRATSSASKPGKARRGQGPVAATPQGAGCRVGTAQLCIRGAPPVQTRFPGDWRGASLRSHPPPPPNRTPCAAGPPAPHAASSVITTGLERHWCRRPADTRHQQSISACLSGGRQLTAAHGRRWRGGRGVRAEGGLDFF